MVHAMFAQANQASGDIHFLCDSPTTRGWFSSGPISKTALSKNLAPTRFRYDL